MEKQENAVSQYDRMTKTPIPKLIVQLSIPTVLSMMVTNIYNMVDTMFVGKLGTSASGAVGVIFGFMAILQACGFMCGQGCGSMMARKLGQKDVMEASRLVSTGFFMAFSLGLCISFGGFVFLQPLVRLLGSTETIAPYACDYIHWILMAAPFMVSSLVLNNVLRYEGKAKLGMIGLLTGALLNIALDPLFMFVFQMGIGGAGLATALSQSISFSILLSMFLRGKTQSRLSIYNVRLQISMIAEIVATGFPSMLRQGLGSVSTMMLNSYAAVYGDAAVAAMSIVSRVIMFVFSIGVGIGQGFQPVSSFNYGAGKYKRVRQGFRFTWFLAQICVSILIVAALVKSGSVIQIFRDDPQVIEIGTRALRLQAIALFSLPFSMVTEMMMQSTGQKLSASILSSLRNGILFIPALMILTHFRGLMGIQEAQPLSFLLAFGISAFFAIRFFKKLPKEDVPDQE